LHQPGLVIHENGFVGHIGLFVLQLPGRVFAFNAFNSEGKSLAGGIWGQKVPQHPLTRE